MSTRPTSIPPLLYQAPELNLNALPVEILLPIMKNADIHSLWGLIVASKRLYGVFNNHAAGIISAVLSSGNNPDEVANFMRAVVIIRFMRSPEMTELLALDYRLRSIIMPAFADFPTPVPTSTLRKLAHLAYKIHGLAHCCLESSLAKCRGQLARPNNRAALDSLWIPHQVAKQMPTSAWFSRQFSWSVQVENTTVLTLWHLQYFYELKEAFYKRRGSLHHSFYTATHPLAMADVSTFFQPSVCKQVLTVLTILDDIAGIERPKPPLIRITPAESSAWRARFPRRVSRRVEARAWLDGQRTSEPETPDDPVEWSRWTGPWRLPELSQIRGLATEFPGWHRECPVVRVVQPTALETPTFAWPSWEISPAERFLRATIRPGLTRFGNVAERRLSATLYLDLGVFLFDEKLLVELGLWPGDGLGSLQTGRDREGILDSDRYPWMWLKLLTGDKLTDLVGEEQEDGWENMARREVRCLDALDIPAWVRREFEGISRNDEIQMTREYIRYLRPWYEMDGWSEDEEDRMMTEE